MMFSIKGRPGLVQPSQICQNTCVEEKVEMESGKPGSGGMGGEHGGLGQ